jgi:CRP-like cAMP-binding protein
MAARNVMRKMASGAKNKPHGKQSGEHHQKDGVSHIDTAAEISRYKHFWSAVETDIEIQSHKMVDSIRSHKNAHIPTASEVLRELRQQNLFNPNDNWKIVWDCVVGAMVLYSVIAIPYRVGFRKESPVGGAFYIVDWMIDGWFMLDIMVTCNTAVLDESTELFILDRKKIFNIYSQFWLWIDVMSCIPFDTIATGAGGVTGAYATLRLVRVLRLARLLKIVRMFKLKRLRKTIENMNVSPSLIAMFSLVFQITFLSHFIACFWFYLSTEDVTGVAPPDISYADSPWYDLPDQRQVTWVTVGNLQYSSELDQYVAAIYWVITTMLSVGYGEISGTNDTERIFCIFTMLVGGVVFGAVIAQVTQMIEKQNPQLSAYKAKMDEVKAYLGEKRLPSHVKVKALDAYSYYLKRKSSFGEAYILDGLPEELKTKLVYELYFREIKDITLFAQARTYAERQFVVRIVQNIKPQRAVRGESIFRAGDIAKNVVFVMSGVIRISTLVDDTQEVVVGYCSKGGFFGEIEYHKKTLRIADYKAVLNCSLLSVPTHVLDSACEEFPEAGAKFKRLLDYRSDNFQKAVKMPPIRSPTKASGRPTLLGSSLTYKASTVLSYALRPLQPCLKLFEADPHTSGTHLGGHTSDRRKSEFTSGKSLPSRLQLFVDGELRLPVTLGDDFKMTNEEDMRTYRIMYLDTSSVVFQKEEAADNGMLKRRKTGMGAEPPTAADLDPKQLRRDLESIKDSHLRGGAVSGSSPGSSGIVGSGNESSGSSPNKRKKKNKKSKNSGPGLFMRAMTVVKNTFMPIATLVGKKKKQKGKKVKSAANNDRDSDSSDENGPKLERELSERLEATEEGAADVPAEETEKEARERKQKEEEIAQGGTVVYCEAGLEFFAFNNLLHPDGKWKNRWSVFISVLVVYSLLSVPIQVGFAAQSSMPLGLLVWEWVVDLLFLGDVLVCLNTSFYSLYDDAYVLIRPRVYEHYFKSMFWPDILSALPYDEILIAMFVRYPSYHTYLQLLKLLKLGRAMKLGKYIRDLENQLGISPAVFDLIKLCIEVLFVGHIFCCVWWAMSVAMTQTSWIDEPDNDYSLDGSVLRDETLFAQYVSSLYLTFSTLTTVGYGDIVPNNTSERFANIFVELMGATVFGYMVASVSTLLGSLNFSEEKVRQRLSEVTEYLAEKKCPQLLSNAVVRHYKHKFSHVSAFDEDEILNRLPQRHAVDIVVHNNANQIKHIPIFAHIENKSVQAYLFQLMEASYFDTNQIIFSEGEESTEILFLVRGQASVLGYMPPQKHVHTDTRMMPDDKTLLQRLDADGADNVLRLRSKSADAEAKEEGGEDSADENTHDEHQRDITTAATTTTPFIDQDKTRFDSSDSSGAEDGKQSKKTEAAPKATPSRRKLKRAQGADDDKKGGGSSGHMGSKCSGGGIDPRPSDGNSVGNNVPLKAAGKDDSDTGKVRSASPAGAESKEDGGIDSSSSSDEESRKPVSNRIAPRLQKMRDRLRAKANSIDKDVYSSSSDDFATDSNSDAGDGGDEGGGSTRAAELTSGSATGKGNALSRFSMRARASSMRVIESIGIGKKNRIAAEKDENGEHADHDRVPLPGGGSVPNQYKGSKKFPSSSLKPGMPGYKGPNGDKHATKTRGRANNRMTPAQHAQDAADLHKRHHWHDDDEAAELKKKKRQGSNTYEENKIIGEIDLDDLSSEYRQIGLIDEGDFMGHDALMRAGKHRATVVAVRPCSIYSLKKSAINQLLREHPAIGAILQNALARCIDTMQKELGRHHYITSRAEFLKGVKNRFKKETQLTASINKLVMQSQLLNNQSIHGHDIGSALQSSLLSNNKALVGRIEASQSPRSRLSVEKDSFNSSRNSAIASPRQGNNNDGNADMNSPPGTPMRGGRLKNNAVSPHSPGGPNSPKSTMPPTVVSRLTMTERELMQRVDSVINYNTIFYDSEEEVFDAMNHRMKKRSLRRRMTEMLTQKSVRDVVKNRKFVRVLRKKHPEASHKFGFSLKKKNPTKESSHHTAWDSDSSSSDSDEASIDSEEEKRMVEHKLFITAGVMGQMRRHRSYDDLLECSEAARITKYSIPLSDRDAFTPFPSFPHGVLPSHLEQKAAIAMAYRRRISNIATPINGVAFTNLLKESKKAADFSNDHDESAAGSAAVSPGRHQEKSATVVNMGAEDEGVNDNEGSGSSSPGSKEGRRTLGSMVGNLMLNPIKDRPMKSIKGLLQRRKEKELEEGRAEVQEMKREQRRRRRQSFPSPYHEYWRDSKVKDGVV